MGLSHLYPSWVRYKRPRKRQVMSPTDVHWPKDRSSTDTNLCLCLYNYCLSISCRLCTHTHTLLGSINFQNKPFLSLSLIFSCVASIAFCVSFPLLNLDFLPGPILGVGEKRGGANLLKILLLCPPPLSDSPESGGFLLPRLHGRRLGSRLLSWFSSVSSSLPSLLNHATLKRHWVAQCQLRECTFANFYLSTAATMDL